MQEMLRGNFTRVGQGGVRTVFLVEYEGRKLAVKTLNDKKRLAKHVREVATLNAVSTCVNCAGICEQGVDRSAGLTRVGLSRVSRVGES